MFRVNIEKQLDAEKVKTQQGETLVKEAKLLLDGNHQRERDLLKKIGLGHSIIKAETARGLGIERQNLEEKYEGKVYMIDEIKNLCLDYDLRFLNTEHFKGHIDTEIGYKVKSFFDKHKLNENYDNKMFYILAPKKAFNLEDRPKPPPVDPILFYRPNRNEQKYLMVHQWGNDFTILRLIKGLMVRTAWSYYFSMSILGLCGFNIILALTRDFYEPMGNFIISFFVGLVFGLIMLACKMGIEDEWSNKKFNIELWDTNYK